MAENKTQKTDASVDDYLAGIAGGHGEDARHTTSVGCLYVKRLADVDSGVLSDLVSRSVQDTRGGG